MKITHAEVVKGLAEHNFNVAAVARELLVHRNTIDYHIRMIRHETGLNPLNYYDLGELLRRANAVLEGEHDD